MRKSLALAALAAAAASLIPATSASASCFIVDPVPGCHSLCPHAVYNAVDDAAGGALPNLAGACTL